MPGRFVLGGLGVLLTSAVLIAPSAPAFGQGHAPFHPSQLWQARYDGGDQDFPLGMAVSPDGTTVYVTGYSLDPVDSSTDAVTVAYDAATGAQRWVARYEDPSGASDAVAVAVSPDGSLVFVTGCIVGADISCDVMTLAYDSATGEQQWLATYSGPGSAIDQGSAVGVSPDGGTVFVTGRSDVGSISESATFAYDAATGAQLWMDLYEGPTGAGDNSVDLGISPDGAMLFVTGSSGGDFTAADYVTVGYDAATGTREWVATYDGPGHGADNAVALAVDPSGSAVVVTGSSTGSDGFRTYATLSYDAATGIQRWLARYGIRHDYPDVFDVAVNPRDGGVFVTGAVGTDMGTVAYDPETGAQRWSARYDGGGSSLDEGKSVAVAPDGRRVYVAGFSFQAPPNAFAWVTVAYDAPTGRALGVIRASPGEALAVAVSPTGSEIFITGWAGINDPQDFRTMAYGL
jgi:hypothetical protein